MPTRSSYPAATDSALLAQFLSDVTCPFEVRRRAEEDMRRDPVDAANDADVLVRILLAVSEVLCHVETSYVLAHRLRADLHRQDAGAALADAMRLARFSHARAAVAGCAAGNQAGEQPHD